MGEFLSNRYNALIYNNIFAKRFKRRPLTFLATFFKCQLHKPNHLFIYIFFPIHPEMVIELLLARNLCNFMKAKVIVKRFFKGKCNVNKIPSQSCDISDPGLDSKSNHRFCRMNRYFTYLLVLLHEIPEQ